MIHKNKNEAGWLVDMLIIYLPLILLTVAGYSQLFPPVNSLYFLAKLHLPQKGKHKTYSDGGNPQTN